MINIITTQSFINYYGQDWTAKSIGSESGSILNTIVSQSNMYISNILANKYDTASYSSDTYLQYLTHEYMYVSICKRRPNIYT